MTSAKYCPTSNVHSELGVKRCKHALRRAQLVKHGDPHRIFSMAQELTLNDCNSSAKDLFLKLKIKSNLIYEVRERPPFNWRAEVELREKVRQARQLSGQKLAPLPTLQTGDRVRLQNLVGNKRWETLGHILAPIKNRDSYTVKLDNGNVDTFHGKHIRKEPEESGELSDPTGGFSEARSVRVTLHQKRRRQLQECVQGHRGEKCCLQNRVDS